MARGQIRSSRCSTHPQPEEKPFLIFTLGVLGNYADTPMDFVDACLVAMSEAKHDCRLLTLDSDFRIYRRFERQAILLIVPAK